MNPRFRNPFVKVVLLLLCTLVVALIFKLRPTAQPAETSIQPTTKHYSQKRYIQLKSPDASSTGTTDTTTPSASTTTQSLRKSPLQTTQKFGTLATLSSRKNSEQPVRKLLAGRTHTTPRTETLTPEALEILSPKSLGSTPDPVSPANQESQPPATVFVEEAKLPIALALPESVVTQLSPQEQTEIQRVQDSFTQDISASPSQDPETPEYFSYWKSARFRQDEQLRITLGWDRFNRLSALAAQHMTSPTP